MRENIYTPYIHTPIHIQMYLMKKLASQCSSKMTPSKHNLYVLLLLLVLICSYSTPTIDAASVAKHNTTVLYLPDDASSLLQLKSSFIDVDENLASWRPGSDCCRWEGVTCDTASARVISLDLGGFDMQGRRLDPALFNLTFLRNLSLAFIDFRPAQLPSYGFERLTNMIHLNFSETNFLGQIPIGISHLKNLVTLDFSYNYGLYLQEPSFQTFMANLSNLRELRLDNVDISKSGSTWSAVLAHSVPQLQILSLLACGISGPIHPSFARLHSLREIDLQVNELTGKVPEFFTEFSSLSILQISVTSFGGQFPAKIFQMKSLRTLSLFSNPSISVCLPDFPVGSNLETLLLAGSTLSCGIPSFFINLKYLKILGVSTIGVSKELSLIHKLPSLNALWLHGHALEKQVLSWTGNLTQLTSLALDGYDFSQSVPSWIGKLASLTDLYIENCNFSGPIPHQIGNLTNLAILYSTECNYNEQPVPSWIVNLKKSRSLNLGNCNLSGPIPSTLENLTQLEELQLEQNKLSGEIPKWLFALPALQFLGLSSNKISGPLKDFAAQLSSRISSIDLSMNQLTGPIPKSFFQLKHLKYLELNSNRLSGTLELSSFWSMTSLSSLDLSNNMISVMDKEGDNVSPSLPKINILDLSSCNLTKIPGALRYVDSIIALDLSSNLINGIIPSWVWENWKDRLMSLNLSSNMFTTLEKSPSLVHMPRLRLLDLSFNRLQGNIPIPITNVEAILDYSNNNFSSIEPDFGKYLRNCIYLDLSKNKLNGRIPSSICRAKQQLDTLDLSYNNFSGSVPSCLIESGELSTLKLRENQLHGMLPENIQERCMFQTIDLNGNQFEGKLPRSLSNCQDLVLLDVGNNWIVDSFPSWLGVLPQLRVLILSSNQFNGTIRNTKGDRPIINHFKSLQILDLASNNFFGNLPKGWFNELKAMMGNANDQGQVLGHATNFSTRFYQDTVSITFKGFKLSFTKMLSTFKAIDFSNNSFDGPIPESIGRLVSLHGLNMSHNNFVGQIPSHFSNLSQLEALDLSRNQLSGEIPQDLTSLTSLEWLNLAYNNLSGRIPQGNQFLTFSDSSFEGNMGLCGLPLSKQCDTPASIAPNAVSPQESNSLWQDKLGAILLFAFVGLGFGVGFALSLVLRLRWRIEGWICKH